MGDAVIISDVVEALTMAEKAPGSPAYARKAATLAKERLIALARKHEALLARHPAPSPSVSRDAETRAIDAARRLDAACRKHEEHGDNFPAYWIREEIDALRAALDAPSPRSEAESGPQWMPGGAFCSCGEVEFLVPGTATVRTSTRGVALPTVHTPTECRSATWDEVSNLSDPVPAESATKEAAAPVVSTVVWTEPGADGTCSGRCARCNTRWNAYPSEQNGISDAHWRTGCGAAATKGEETGR